MELRGRLNQSITCKNHSRAKDFDRQAIRSKALYGQAEQRKKIELVTREIIGKRCCAPFGSQVCREASRKFEVAADYRFAPSSKHRHAPSAEQEHNSSFRRRQRRRRQLGCAILELEAGQA